MTLFQYSAILQKDNQYIIQMVHRYSVESPATDSLQECNEIFFSPILTQSNASPLRYESLVLCFEDTLLPKYFKWTLGQQAGRRTLDSVFCVGFFASSVFPDFVSRITLAESTCTAVKDFFQGTISVCEGTSIN